MPKKLIRTRRYPPRDPLQEAADAIADRFVDAVDLLMDRVISRVLPPNPSQAPPQRPQRDPRPPRAQRPPAPHTPSQRTLYDELEVSPAASQETIAAAYKSLARRYHPDHNKHREAAERMRQINAAHQVLSDPGTRERYDRLMGIKR